MTTKREKITVLVDMRALKRLHKLQAALRFTGKHSRRQTTPGKIIEILLLKEDALQYLQENLS